MLRNAIKDCKGTPPFHWLVFDWHHVAIQSLVLPSHLRKLCHYGRYSAGKLRGSTFALGFSTMGSLRHMASCTGSYNVNNTPPSPPPKKRWWICKKYRVFIRHQIQENSPFTMQNFYSDAEPLSNYTYSLICNSFTPFFLLVEFFMKTLNMWKNRFVILFHISCKESSSHHNTCMPGPILPRTAWPSRSLGCSKYQNGQHHCFYQTDE